MCIEGDAGIVSDFYVHIYLFIVRLVSYFFALFSIVVVSSATSHGPTSFSNCVYLNHFKVHVSLPITYFFSVILFASIHIKWDSVFFSQHTFHFRSTFSLNSKRRSWKKTHTTDKKMMCTRARIELSIDGNARQRIFFKRLSASPPFVQ